MRRAIPLLACLIVLAACGSERQVALDCGSDTITKASFDPDRSVPGFADPRDALSILSWSQGLPTLESESDSEVVFVYVEDGMRVGAAFVTPAANGWLADALWICPEG